MLPIQSLFAGLALVLLNGCASSLFSSETAPAAPDLGEGPVQLPDEPTPTATPPAPTPLPTLPPPVPAQEPPQKFTFERRDEGERLVTGRLSTADVQATIGKHLHEIRACYETGLKEYPALEGQVTAQFVIQAGGNVSSSIVAASTLGAPRVETCIASAIRTWQFPRTDRSTTVKYPFALAWESNFTQVQRTLNGCWEAELPTGTLAGFRYLSLSFEKGLTRPQALLASQQSQTLPGRKLSTVLLAYPASVVAANTRNEKVAFVLEATQEKIAFAGTYRQPANRFVGALQTRGRRATVIFERRECRESLIRIGFAPPPLVQPKKGTRVAMEKRRSRVTSR